MSTPDNMDCLRHTGPQHYIDVCGRQWESILHLFQFRPGKTSPIVNHLPNAICSFANASNLFVLVQKQPLIAHIMILTRPMQMFHLFLLI